MNKASLTAAQRLTVEIIEALGFGSVERLLVSGGTPLLEPEPRIVQSLKLDTAASRPPASTNGDLTLKKEFGLLFEELSRLRDGVVDIEVRHGLPFRVLAKRSVKELLRDE